MRMMQKELASPGKFEKMMGVSRALRHSEEEENHLSWKRPAMIWWWEERHSFEQRGGKAHIQDFELREGKKDRKPQEEVAKMANQQAKMKKKQ